MGEFHVLIPLPLLVASLQNEIGNDVSDAVGSEIIKQIKPLLKVLSYPLCLPFASQLQCQCANATAAFHNSFVGYGSRV